MSWCLHPNKGGPELRGPQLGTKLKKALRIQLIRISIKLFHLSLITPHSALLTIVKMLQILKRYVVCSMSYVGE